jgi:hypothetical protein
MVKSFWALMPVARGFRSDSILTARLSLPRSRYPDNRRIAAFERELLETLSRKPGVQSAGLAKLSSGVARDAGGSHGGFATPTILTNNVWSAPDPQAAFIGEELSAALGTQPVASITSRRRSNRDATFRRIIPFANGAKTRINPRGFRVVASSTRVLGPCSKKR